MYTTKLMMNQISAPPGYIEDDSLVFKRENELWGYTSGGSPNYKTITNLDKGIKGVTYCGTLPLDVKGDWILTIIRYRVILYRYADNRIMIRNYQNGSGITPASTIKATDGIQPYVAVTLYFPTPTTQTVGLSVEGEDIQSVTGSWAGTTTQAQVAMLHNDVLKTEPMELALLYDRVLEDWELEQNYQAFLYNHR
jgi:hypothetical protein